MKEVQNQKNNEWGVIVMKERRKRAAMKTTIERRGREVKEESKTG